MSTDEEWRVSKNIPLSLLFAMIVQAVTLVWFFAELNSGIETNQRQIIEHAKRIESLEKLVFELYTKTARIDENIKHIKNAVDRSLDNKGD